MAKMIVKSAGGKLHHLKLEEGVLNVDGVEHQLSTLPAEFAGFSMSLDNWETVMFMLTYGWPKKSYNHLQFYDLIR